MKSMFFYSALMQNEWVSEKATNIYPTSLFKNPPHRPSS